MPWEMWYISTVERRVNDMTLFELLLVSILYWIGFKYYVDRQGD